MASVYPLVPSAAEFYEELQERADEAERIRLKRFKAVMILQRMTRGYLLRKHIAWLSYNARIIQCAFRMHMARKSYRAALKRAVRFKHFKYYARAATIIQALWRGHDSRRTHFCYRTYRRWLATVKERGERRAAEAAEFGIRSRADDLRILEEEARQWLAFVVFKLHHLLRTASCAGVYSKPATTELSEFEQLLISIHYKEYMKRLKRKYEEFVRKHRPAFSNKRLFPIIGYGADYWYLSLAEMYELTAPSDKKDDSRHKATHHGPIHEQPFLWKNLNSPKIKVGRGPFTPPKGPSPSESIMMPPAPSPTPLYVIPESRPKDPRFHLYVKYYKPEPALFDYINYQINALLKHKSSIEEIGCGK